MFKQFCEKNPYLTLEQSIEYFSILGGAEQSVELDFFDDVFSMVESNFVKNFYKYQTMVSPSYIIESPYRELLMSIARGDGKIYSVFRKAKLSQGVGEALVEELISLGIIYVEKSRESPLKIHPKNKLKKELRSYRIQDKLRFVKPFHRFWFAFVTYYKEDLINADGEKFFENFHNHYERLRTLIYEQLCNALLIEHYKGSSALLSSGSYWDQHSEFDILAITKDKRIVLAECKYKERKVCKNELNKLKDRAIHSGIKVDVFILFSKSGFSKELESLKDENLLLFDLNDLKILLD